MVPVLQPLGARNETHPVLKRDNDMQDVAWLDDSFRHWRKGIKTLTEADVPE